MFHYLLWPSVTLLVDLFLGWTLIGWVAALSMTAGSCRSAQARGTFVSLVTPQEKAGE